MNETTHSRGFNKHIAPLMALFLLAFGILALVPAVQAQQIQMDTSNNSLKTYGSGINGTTSTNWTHFVDGSLPYRKLVVVVNAKDTLSQNITFNNVTCGNEELTLVVQENRDGGSHRQLSGIFYMDNPPAGNNLITVRFEHNAEFITGGAYTLYNAAPTDPVATHSHRGNSSNAGGAIATPVNACMIISTLALNGDNRPTAEAPSTQLFYWRGSAGGAYFHGAASYLFVANPSSQLMKYSHKSNYFAHSIAAFQSVGRLIVNITGPPAARWMAGGEGDWLASGASVDLPPGTEFLVSCDNQLNLNRPEDILVEVASGQTVIKNMAYKANLAYSAGAGGSVTGAVTQSVNYGANGSQVVAVPAPGYQFDKWSDDVANASRTDTNVTGHKNITAFFKERHRTVTYSVSPAGAGTVTGLDSIQDTVGEIIFIVEAGAGYDLDGLNFETTSGDVIPLGGGEFKLVNVKANTVVTAEFGATEYNVSYTVDPAESGTVSGGLTVIQASLGTTTFSVAPQSGYTPFLVTATRGAITNLGGGQYRLSHVTRDTVVTAVFVKKMYSISYTSTKPEAVTFTGPPSIQEGGEIEFTIDVAPGSSFMGFNVTHPAQWASLGGNCYVLSGATGNVRIEAFVQ